MNDFKAHLPAPLATTWHLMSLQATGVRPSYLHAVNYLIDLTELYTQICTSILLSLLSRTSRTVSPEFSRYLEAFFKTSLNLGHWLECWKLAATELIQSRVEGDRHFEPVAKFILDNSLNRRETLNEIDKLPQFRNRKRGHTFTLPESEAKTVWENNHGRVEAILSTSEFLWSDLLFLVVRDVDGDLCELAVMRGNVSLSQADSILLNICNPPKRSEVVVIPRILSQAPTLTPDAILPVSPLILCEDEELFFYQRSSKATSFFMSIKAKEIEHSAQGIIKHFQGFFPTSPSEKKKTPKLPSWAEKLQAHDLLCEASCFSSTPHPQGFYRGNVPSWADLRFIRLKRTLSHEEL